MADVRCPNCRRPNPKDLETCQYCGARLKPILGPTSGGSQPLKPGEEPIKKNTSELDRAKLNREGPIHPGEAPTKKNTAELERALPDWLRSLREEKRPAAGESLAEPSDQGQPAASQAASGPDSSGGLPDWLSGLGGAASDEEEVPDWLAGLRQDNPAESPVASTADVGSAPNVSEEDWMKRLGGESPEPAQEPIETAKGPAEEEPAFEAPPEPASAGNVPDWLRSLQPQESGAQEPPSASQDREDLPVWLNNLPDITPEPNAAEEPASTESTSDWLEQLNRESIAPETSTPAGGAQNLPDWLASVESAPAAPAPVPAPAENIPEWLSNLEESKSEPEPEPSAPLSGNEPPASSTLPGEIPDWLAGLQTKASAEGQAEQHVDDFGAISEAPASPKGTGPFPDRMAGTVEPPPPSAGTPALIMDEKDILPEGQGEAAFPTETPDWLSKLRPEPGAEKAVESNAPSAEPENLETAELPSWVQAMRPVEAVVESKMTPLDENQVAEQSGPLAGLRGVLPASPGLGPLRKPPAYSTKLQVSDGQNRYATTLEGLIAGETNPRAVRETHPISNRLWRWLITLALFLAVGIPFANSTQFAPASLLSSSDKGAASKIIDGLSQNAPVLIAFDYEPALSGELEAVAAPVMDQLLSKGIPLALISTSPTGPVLAEHFLQTTPLVNVHQYQSGVQYVNLGYLAGGSAGMRFFAASPTDAMPVAVDGGSAWKTGPLQNIRSLSNFAAVIILTDNADTGRNWIEQTGSRLGQVPMLMIISAQAEPMILPYFDSGQLKGLISGLSDSKIYEQAYNRPGLAYHYWNSFSVGMLVAELLIGVGAILSFVTNRRARGKA